MCVGGWEQMTAYMLIYVMQTNGNPCITSAFEVSAWRPPPPPPSHRRSAEAETGGINLVPFWLRVYTSSCWVQSQLFLDPSVLLLPVISLNNLSGQTAHLPPAAFPGLIAKKHKPVLVASPLPLFVYRR